MHFLITLKLNSACLKGKVLRGRALVHYKDFSYHQNLKMLGDQVLSPDPTFTLTENK